MKAPTTVEMAPRPRPVDETLEAPLALLEIEAAAEDAFEAAEETLDAAAEAEAAPPEDLAEAGGRGDMPAAVRSVERRRGNQMRRKRDGPEPTAEAEATRTELIALEAAAATLQGGGRKAERGDGGDERSSGTVSGGEEQIRPATTISSRETRTSKRRRWRWRRGSRGPRSAQRLRPRTRWARQSRSAQRRTRWLPRYWRPTRGPPPGGRRPCCKRWAGSREGARQGLGGATGAEREDRRRE